MTRLINYLNFFLMMQVVIFLFSCASPSARENRLDVRPGVDGIHKVVIISKNQVEGSREALNQADQYCKEIKKSAYFFNSAPKDDTNIKQKVPVNSANTNLKKSTSEEPETEKMLTIEMLFKCL